MKMSINISNEYFTHQYMDNVEGYIVNNIDSENTILVSKTPILIGQCRFRVSLFMKNKILIKVTLVAVTVQEHQTYTDIPTREVHEKWAKNNFREPDFVEVFGYRYMLPDAEIITEHDLRSGSASIDSISKSTFYGIKNQLVPYEPEKQFPNAYKQWEEKFDGNKPVACIISNDDYKNVQFNAKFNNGLGRTENNGQESSHFVISLEDAQQLFDNCTDLKELGTKLGLGEGKYADHGGARLVIIQPNSIENMRYSTIDTQGSNEWWAPGLMTSGGQFEAVIARLEDVLARDPDITVSSLKK